MPLRAEVCPAPPRAYSLWGGPGNIGNLRPTAVFVGEEWLEFGCQEVGLWHKVAKFQVDLSSICYLLAKDSWTLRLAKVAKISPILVEASKSQIIHQ